VQPLCHVDIVGFVRPTKWTDKCSQSSRLFVCCWSECVVRAGRGLRVGRFRVKGIGVRGSPLTLVALMKHAPL